MLLILIQLKTIKLEVVAKINSKKIQKSIEPDFYNFLFT